MEKEQGREWGRSAWKRLAGIGIPADFISFPLLGAVTYVLFRHAAALDPIEGALLTLGAAGLLRVGLRGWNWHRGLIHEGTFMDWVQRVQRGERNLLEVPEGLRERDRQVAAALNAVIGDTRTAHKDLSALQSAAAREWRELDSLLEAVQRDHSTEEEVRVSGGARLASLGRELKAAIEGTLRHDQIELNHRLRADQFRVQGQAFRSTLDHLRASLEQFEGLLEELQDSFPRLRREEDALERLADAGLRQGARLALAMKGLVAHTPRLLGETQERTEGLRRLRQSADGVQDQTEALARRIEGFRDEAQARIRSFGEAQGSMAELGHVAQQTGLLAVNAAILAQQGGGSAGMAAIGGRLRSLADQTTEGATGMKRALDEYQRGLDRETAGLWDLQEITQRLLADVHELLRAAGQLDHQGSDLERALETHLGLVDQARQASERVELSLHEVGARAMGLQSAHGRQWGVETKIAPERERLSRIGSRLAEVGDELARISQENIDEIWDILARHQEIRQTEAYRRVTSEGLRGLQGGTEETSPVWNGVAWARARRRFRLVEPGGEPLPMGRREADGELGLRLIGQDALQGPEVSALESWRCDRAGQAWRLHLLPHLRTESHRLALMAVLKESPLPACFPGIDLRIVPEGAVATLPHPYPRLPEFLAGLRLELPVEPHLQDLSFKEVEPEPRSVQRLAWMGPGAGGGRRHQGMRLVHAWVSGDDRHEAFLPGLPYPGNRPTCPWLGDRGAGDRLEAPLAVHCLGLGADAALLNPMRDRLVQAGAMEGPGGLILCAIGISHPHPEAVLLRLFQSDANLAGAFHTDLVPYQVRLREEVLGGSAGDPYRAAWSILEDLQGKGWLMPLPPE